MNSFQSPERPPNPTNNIQNAPYNMNNQNRPPPPRMIQPNPNMRFEGNQQFQQGNMDPNFQQRPRFPGNEMPRFPPNNSQRPENQRPDFQKNPPGPPIFGQRVLPPGPPPRFPNSQPMRPPMNGQDPSLIIKRPPMETQNHRYQANDQRPIESDNFRGNENIQRNHNQFLARKSSNLELKPQMEINGVKKIEVETKPQTLVKHEENTENVQEKLNGEDSKILEEDITEKTKSEIKTKEKLFKQNSQKQILKEEITSGLVQKNIKYFEENDTAKIPLTPTSPVKVKRKEKTQSSISDVVKGDFNDDNYESGVDESPMIHPNLKSIYQPPSKVAKIPLIKSKAKKFKREILKKKKLEREKLLLGDSKSLKMFLHSNCKHGHKKKVEKEENFGPEEELLAFFRNSKPTRPKIRDGSLKNDISATKNKVGSKPTTNGDIATPKKTPSKLPAPSKKNPTLSSPTKTPLKSPGTPGTPGTPGSKSLPKTPETPNPPTPLIKKVPMNKIQVGAAPSPNLKAVRSKVGSLANTTHKPGGGNIKIESHKIDFSKTQPRIEAKNDQYAPSGGDKKITQVKLQWSAKSKVGSLENATYKPGGGDKKIETVKLDFKEKAKPKVGSKDNVKHVPGGGAVKIENQKLEFKAQSKVGSLDNVKHKPGGGDIKIFDDKTYLKQISGNSSEGRVSGTQSYGDLSIVREVEGRSAPGTPGRKTAVKIKKTTTIYSSGVKNTTEVMVTSQTPKKQKNQEKTSSKEQVKLTYSKMSPLKQKDNNLSPIRVMKLPAKENAPILKPNLGNKEAFETNKDTDNKQHRPGSSNLFDDKLKNDPGMTKFLQDEMMAHEKVGEMWKERNTLIDNIKESNNNMPDMFNQQRRQQNNMEVKKIPPEPLARTSIFDSSNYMNQGSVRPPQNIYEQNQSQSSNFSFQQGTRYISPNQNQSFDSQI